MPDKFNLGSSAEMGDDFFDVSGAVIFTDWQGTSTIAIDLLGGFDIQGSKSFSVDIVSLTNGVRINNPRDIQLLPGDDECAVFADIFER